MRPVAIEYGVNQYRFRYCSPRYRSIAQGANQIVQPFRTIVVDVAKLRDYCLADSHPRGRHKARVFHSRLGLTAADADVLQQALLEAARDRPQDLHPSQSDRYGQRYVLDFEMTTPGGTAVVRSGWIAPVGQDVLHFLTCYIL